MKKKLWKLCLVLLLTCAMLLGLNGCAVASIPHSDDSLVGYYTFVSGTDGTTALTYDEDKEPCVVFREDGTVTLFLGESLVTCKREGQKLIADGSEDYYTCSFVGATLFLKAADAELKLLYSKQEPPTDEELHARLIPPEVGYYLFTTLKVDGKPMDSLVEIGTQDKLCLVLYADHNGIYRSLDRSTDMAWQDGMIKPANGSGVAVQYELTEDGIVLHSDDEDVFFTRQPGDVPTPEELDEIFAAYDVPDTATPDAAIPDAESLSYWNGDWYGWWQLVDGTGVYAEYNEQWWDMCARITLSEDGSAEMVLWDEDLPESNPLGKVTLYYLAADNASKYGYLVSDDGMFFDVPVAQDEWTLIGESSWEFENILLLENTVLDGSDTFTFHFVLRPWGTLWNDVSEDGLPYYYESWYLPLLEAGEEMPSSIELPD